MSRGLRQISYATALCLAALASAQEPPRVVVHQGGADRVLMLSDLHFDPLRDPAKVKRLSNANVEDWSAILSEAPSEHQADDFAATQAGCKATAVDTSYALLSESLRAAKAQPMPLEAVLVSGDLLAHNLDCRYGQVMKGDSQGYARFAAKTAEFVMMRVEDQFPNVPVSFALGNNDSGCGDYRLDANDAFLAATSGMIVRGLRRSTDVEKSKVRRSYESGGFYAASIGVQKTRLLVIDDLFLSNKYKTCSGKKDDAGAALQMTWLESELKQARARGEHAWLLGHLPPGIDIYATLTHVLSMCTRQPDTFMSGGALARLMAEYKDVIQLGIFGHTHEDEFRVIGGVPVKLVGSISPNNGNAPSFTVAEVDPLTGSMIDYAVYTAPDATGAKAAWKQEYGFRTTYHQTNFRADTLNDLVAKFSADPNGASPMSAAYVHNFFPGDKPSPLALAWPQYVCALNHADEATFKDCLCPKQ